MSLGGSAHHAVPPLIERAPRHGHRRGDRPVATARPQRLPDHVRRDLGHPRRHPGRIARPRRQGRHDLHRPVGALHPRRRADHHRRVGRLDRDRGRAGHPRFAGPPLPESRDLRHRELLRLARARDAAHRPAAVLLPRPAPDLGRVREDPVARARDRGARVQLRRLHDGDLPGRHPGHPARPDRGRVGARHDRSHDDAPDHPAPGGPDHHARDRQRVHRHDQGLGARVDHHRPGAPVARPA